MGPSDLVQQYVLGLHQASAGEALPEPALLEYLTDYLQDEAATLQDLEETVSVICPGFELRDSEGRRRELKALQQRVRDGCPKLPGLRGDSERQPAQLSTEQAGPQAESASEPEPQPAQAAEAVPEPEVAVLREICPGGEQLPASFLHHLLTVQGEGNLQAAAAWLMDAGEEELEAEKLRWRLLCDSRAAQSRAAQPSPTTQQEQRKQLLAKYWLQAQRKQPGERCVASRDTVMHQLFKDAPALPKVRYREGVPVTSRGEKHVVEVLGEEWDGGSRGKVKSKGKRGKGFV